MVCSSRILDGSKLLMAQGKFLRNPVVIAQVAGIIGEKK
jgi:hypothetical protein